MNRHNQTYTDLYPEHVTREPSALVVWCGAAVLMASVWAVTFVLFSL